MIERITWNGQLMALVLRAEHRPSETTFVTAPDLTLQAGYVVYRAGEEIPRHVHLPVERHIVGSMEVLLVQEGRCAVDVYTDQRELVDTRELRRGDVLVAVSGGHGFRVLEDTVLLEIKQGPYPGVAEKERF